MARTVLTKTEKLRIMLGQVTRSIREMGEVKARAERMKLAMIARATGHSIMQLERTLACIETALRKSEQEEI